MSSWASLHNHSNYSLLHSSSNIIKMCERAVQIGLPAFALTDEGAITGTPTFVKALKETCVCGHSKKTHFKQTEGTDRCYGHAKTCKCDKFKPADIKPILGSEFRINHNDKISSLVVVAKNLAGWKKLISATSEANREHNIKNEKATISLDDLSKFCDGNLIGMTGALGSLTSDALFDNPAAVYFATTYSQVRSFSSRKCYDSALELAGRCSDIFGKDNFFLQTNLMTQEENPACAVSTAAMRSIAKATKIPLVASAPSYYVSPDDYDDQKLLLCSSMESNYNNVEQKLPNENNAYLKQFFRSHKHYIPASEEIINLHEQEEVKNSLLIAEMCESYNILSKPILPIFDCPDGKTPDEYLKSICVKNWNEKVVKKGEKGRIEEYKNQIREELRVIQGAKLSSYFLIVEDYCRWATENGQLLGPGRGSAAGSLIAYLTHITKIDPIRYGLMFERFYNEGRNTEDRTSLPDVDTDFEDRDAVIEYVAGKYGRDRVGQMVTFSRIQGKGAIKEVFRVKYPDTSMDLINKITDCIPDESAINDKLQEMREAGEDPSIIMYALDSNAKALKQYCFLDDNGKLQGEFSNAIGQAIRLEGTRKSQGKHASGVIISNTKLADIAPMVYDKTSKKSVVGLEMGPAEDIGLVKFDFLNLSCMSKLHGVSRILATGKVK